MTENTMSDKSIIKCKEWVQLEGVGEPVIAEDDLAKKLGYKRAAKLRELVDTIISEDTLGIFNDILILPQLGRIGPGRRKVKGERAHTFRQAMHVLSRANTTNAGIVRDDMITSYQSVMNARLGVSVVAYSPLIKYGPTVRDNADMTSSLADMLQRASLVANCSLQMVLGSIRRHFNVGSPYAMLSEHWTILADYLQRIIDGVVRPRHKCKKMPKADPRQLPMFAQP
jgi:hypothetical protein